MRIQKHEEGLKKHGRGSKPSGRRLTTKFYHCIIVHKTHQHNHYLMMSQLHAWTKKRVDNADMFIKPLQYIVVLEIHWVVQPILNSTSYTSQLQLCIFTVTVPFHFPFHRSILYSSPVITRFTPSQLRACCVGETLQTSRNPSNLNLVNQSVVKKLLPTQYLLSEGI